MKGHIEHFSEARFNREKEREYLFDLLNDGAVIGWTRTFPDACPSDPDTEYFIVPADAPTPGTSLGELRIFAVERAVYEIAKRAGKLAETCPTCGHVLPVRGRGLS